MNQMNYPGFFVGDQTAQNGQNIAKNRGIKFHYSFVVGDTFDGNVAWNGFLQEWYYRADASGIVGHVWPETEKKGKLALEILISIGRVNSKQVVNYFALSSHDFDFYFAVWEINNNNDVAQMDDKANMYRPGLDSLTRSESRFAVHYNWSRWHIEYVGRSIYVKSWSFETALFVDRIGNISRGLSYVELNWDTIFVVIENTIWRKVNNEWLTNRRDHNR